MRYTYSVQVSEFEIINREQIGSDYFVIHGKLNPEPSTQPFPGQFCQIKCDNIDHSQILWRPYSWLTIENGIYCMLVQRVGQGSRAFCERPLGSKQPIITHLGNHFDTNYAESERQYNVVLIAGGVGLAPMIMLSRYLKSHYTNVKYTFIFGGRNKEAVFPNWIKQLESEVIFCTEDGSVGRKGFVTHELEAQMLNQNFDALYTCGPNAMMAAIAKLVNNQIPFCQASMEARMACAIGVCYGCAIPYEIPTNMKTVCKEGPVFDLKKICWDLIID